MSIVLNTKNCLNIDFIFDGFLLWIQLYVDSESIINSLNESFWGTVFLKTKEKFQLLKGDEIIAVCERKLSKNGVNPDYFIHGVVRCGDNEDMTFDIDSYYTTP